MTDFTINLRKGEETYIFRYDEKSIANMVKYVADLARSQRTSFDWFDAAVVCKNITDRLPSGQELSDKI